MYSGCFNQTRCRIFQNTHLSFENVELVGCLPCVAWHQAADGYVEIPVPKAFDDLLESCPQFRQPAQIVCAVFSWGMTMQRRDALGQPPCVGYERGRRFPHPRVCLGFVQEPPNHCSSRPLPQLPLTTSQACTLKAASPKHRCIAGGGSLNKAHLCRESEWKSDRQDSVVIRGVKVRCRDLVSASDG